MEKLNFHNTNRCKLSNEYFGHIGIFGMHLLGFLVQRAVSEQNREM